VKGLHSTGVPVQKKKNGWECEDGGSSTKTSKKKKNSLKFGSARIPSISLEITKLGQSLRKREEKLGGGTNIQRTRTSMVGTGGYLKRSHF